ncbi:uncharacterized protein TEOVI_000438400 [Trypanosoma equiperdum]|uniref:Uncharacterized protein n=1 Tax=Trypanosoma equiperdum TaxID=5694 RepID=A0A1G4IJT0_TRYEQ|nr:hypothetical protein, conserved [Trypanosoma equiperdum]
MRVKRKNAAAEGEKAEAARQAELRRYEEEQERLYKLELAAREALEEEWTRAMEAHRQREMELQRAITERELRRGFEEREKKLTDELHGKEVEVLELRAKLCGLQQGLTTIQQERESVMRRLSMVSNELELAQIKYVECDSLVEKTTNEYSEKLREVERARDSLMEDHQQLRAENERQKRAYEDLENQFNEAKSTYLAKVDERLETVEPQSADAETALLLKVLNEEVEKHRETARLLQAELERKGRDEEKSSVLVTLLNSQLENTRDEVKRLHEVSKGRLHQLESVQSLLDSEREKAKTLYRDLDVAHAEATVERRQFNLEIGVHKAQVEELTKALQRAQGELADTKNEFEVYKNKSMEREQGDLQVNIALKAEVEQAKKDFTKVNEDLRTVTEEAYTTKAVLRAEVDSLKVRLQRLQENAERSERESFETIAVLRASEERLLEEKNFSAKNHEEMTRSLRDEIRSVCNERDVFRAEVEKITAEKVEVERDLYQRLLRMTANHDRLHEEVERLTGTYSSREKEFIENAIFTNAEKETLRAKVEELTATLEKRKEEHANHVQQITTDLTDLRDRLEREISKQQLLLKAEKERAEGAEEEVSSLKRQVSGYVAEVGLLNRKREEIEGTMKAEIRDLRMELGAAKRTIERFECTLGDFTYKSIREANDRLLREVEHQREKIATLNDTISSMKVESTIMETYKEKMLSEQNEKYSIHIQHLERLRQMINPLFFELRSIVEKHGLVGPLRRDLDAYDEHVRRSRIVFSQPTASSLHVQEEKNATKSSPAVANSVAAGAACKEPIGTDMLVGRGCDTLPAVAHQTAVEYEKPERIALVPHKPATTQQAVAEHGYHYVLPRIS